MTFSQLSTFSPVKKWVNEDIKKNQVTKLRKIQLKPNKKQQKVLNKYINDSRFIYNEGVNLFNTYGISNHFELVNKIVTKTANYDTIIPNWFYSSIPISIYETPKTIRSQELKVLSTNIKSAFSNLKNKNIKYFKMRFKSKKRLFNEIINEESRTSSITKKNKKEFLNISKLKNIRIKRNKKDKIEYNITSDIKLQKTKLNKYYLLLPYKVDKIENKEDNRICALDPGQRTFLTGIDLKGNIFRIGDNIQENIKKVKQKISDCQSKLSNHKKNTIIEYKNYMRTKYNFYTQTLKLKNLIKELHNKTISYLTTYYDKIILPIYETQKMVKSKMKGFNKQLLSLNHFEFREKLKNKCKELNKKVITVSEEHTSKTCSLCNHYNPLLGSLKKYKCNYCNNVMDRDDNASYNILKNVLLGTLKIY
jgi:putative transposase